MILLVDNYDSFSYNLYQLLGELQPRIKVIRNDQETPEEIRRDDPEAIILSPGPGRPEQAGYCMEIVRQLGDRIPILGGLPGTPGHLRRLWRRDYLRGQAYARQAVPGGGGYRQLDLPGTEQKNSGGPLPFSGSQGGETFRRSCR